MNWKSSVTAVAVIGILAGAGFLRAGQMSPTAHAQAPTQQQPESSPAAPPPHDKQTPQPSLAKEQLVARGEYLTHSVAMCIICHSPKDENGNPVRERQFMGGVIPVRPTMNGMPQWATNAPALGPLVGGTGDDVAHLLQTGIWLQSGQSPRPPMPPFRMNEEDAKAVVAYLRSIQ